MNPPTIAYEYRKPDETYDDLIEQELGECDGGEIYTLASREDHCVKEGACWDHCADPSGHYTEQMAEFELPGYPSSFDAEGNDHYYEE